MAPAHLNLHFLTNQLLIINTGAAIFPDSFHTLVDVPNQDVKRLIARLFLSFFGNCIGPDGKGPVNLLSCVL